MWATRQARLSGRKNGDTNGDGGMMNTGFCDLQLAMNLTNLSNPFSPTSNWQNLNISANSALHQGVAIQTFLWRGLGKVTYASPGP
jgi:hypothetical protein